MLCFATLSFSWAGEIRGKVSDSNSGELLVGTTVYIKELNVATSSGFDGSYVLKNIPEGNYTLICSYISYQQKEISVNINQDVPMMEQNFSLLPKDNELEQVNITAMSNKSTDISARFSERHAAQVINVVSAKTIEISPDLNVANVLQRMSGITLDKTSNDGQYALLRGMDKRYNYTLVNGIKIPSTHNKHRYVSLNMFPSDMVDRIEVTKALTPNMEGDAIGGVVNLIMKNAPEALLIQANASVGYSQFFADNEFLTFDNKVLNSKSPYERNGKGYHAIPADFPTRNLIIKTEPNPVNYYSNITFGNRFFNKQLGWIVSGSYQEINSGESSLYFEDDLSRDGLNLPVLTSMQERTYSENTRSYGIHNKFDYQLSKAHRLQLYTAFLNSDKTQVREVQNTNLSVSYDPESGNINRAHSSRFRNNKQNLLNVTLQGNHQLTEKITANWSLVYSKANNKTPDESKVQYGNSLENGVPVRQYVDFDGSNRVWERNSDQDKSGYLDFSFQPNIFGTRIELLVGVLYRQKNRTSFYNKYTLNAIVNVSNSDTSYTSFYSEKGVDWNTYDEILWRVYNPSGTVAVGENYDAYENVIAAYSMFRFGINKLQITGGVRFENTDQGYYMEYPIGEPEPEGNHQYNDVLPSIHLKYSPALKQNIRLSYYRATNKPGFQEIVPYIDNSEEPATAGNKNLKHAVADNLDLRWEYFPNQLDQIMFGVFYKKIKNPIEFAFDKFRNVSQQIVYTPINSESATNYGFELDLIKYFREWGIKGNFTMTRSSITSLKLARVKDEFGNDSTAYVSQTRPLFGQSDMVGNISLLYKGTSNGINAQLAFSYTGDRIYTVSRYIDNDMWQKGYWQLDVSAEKKFKNGISLFVKAHNLLNSHVKVYIQKTNSLNSDVPFHADGDENTLTRDEYTMPSYLLGIRFKI